MTVFFSVVFAWATFATGASIYLANQLNNEQRMCIRREEFIALRGLWPEFSQWLSEPDAAEGEG